MDALQGPTIRHPKVFAIGGVSVQLVTYMALNDAEAAALVRYLHATQPKVQRAKGKVCIVPWHGDEAALAQFRQPPPRRR